MQAKSADGSEGHCTVSQDRATTPFAAHTTSRNHLYDFDHLTPAHPELSLQSPPSLAISETAALYVSPLRPVVPGSLLSSILSIYCVRVLL